MPLPRIGSLEVAANPRLQERGWRIQRIGWIVMGLLVAAAAAGAFGKGGPLSETTASHAFLTVEYPRFSRRLAPETLRVRFGEEAVRNGQVALWIERAYLEKTTVQEIMPPPLRVVVAPERLTYVFAAEGAGAISFHLQFEGPGAAAGRLGIGSAAVALRQLVYP